LAESRRILSIDRGSSSLKIAVYELGVAHEQCLLAREMRATPGDEAPLAAVLKSMRELDMRVDAVGHRLVYGGPSHEAPATVSPDLLATLTALVPFDPLHLPDALAAVRAIGTALPGLPQVVCFDTAFHRRMPMVAQRLPLPRQLWAEGVRRYGFHGLSYESIVHELGLNGTRGRMIVAHLGNGASLAAIHDGNPIDTTMGFSSFGGLMMGTRPGDLDPGVVLYLIRERGYTLADLGDLLTRRSGLRGVSDISSDMQVLLERRARDVSAAQAIELFVYQVKKYVGALVAVMGGLDTLVFTGGIGEHAAAVRWEIAQGLAHLGIDLEPSRNTAHAAIISTDHSLVVVRVMATRENFMVARHTYTTLYPS
jgi:acetate kinase